MAGWIAQRVIYLAVEQEVWSRVHLGVSYEYGQPAGPWACCTDFIPEGGNGEPLLSILYLEDLDQGCHKSEST